MDVPFLQSDIYEKFEALQERGAGRAQFWEIVAEGVLLLLVVVMAYVVLRLLYRRFFWRGDRRGRGEWNGAEMQGGLLQIGEEMKRRVQLEEVPKNTALYLFWEVGGLVCGCGGTILAAAPHEVKIETSSDSAPVSGEARLVVPDMEGNVSFYDVTVSAASGDRGRTLVSSDGFAAAFMDRAFRMSVNLKAAALVAGGDGGGEGDASSEGVIVRILDLSLDGMGLRSEVALEGSSDVLVRAHFPGYLEPIAVTAKVAWCREELAGIFRAGIAISFSGLDLRLIVADYMYLARRAARQEPELVEA